MSIEDFCLSFPLSFMAPFPPALVPSPPGNSFSPLSHALTRGGTSRSSARRELRMGGRVWSAGGRREGGKDDKVVLSRVRMEIYIVHDWRRGVSKGVR